MKIAIIIGISKEGRFYLADRLPRKGYEISFNSIDHEVSTSHNLEQLGIKGRHHLTSMLGSDFRSFLAALQKIEANENYNLPGQTDRLSGSAYSVKATNLIRNMRSTLNIKNAQHPSSRYND